MARNSETAKAPPTKQPSHPCVLKRKVVDEPYSGFPLKKENYLKLPLQSY